MAERCYTCVHPHSRCHVVTRQQSNYRIRRIRETDCPKPEISAFSRSSRYVLRDLSQFSRDIYNTLCEYYHILLVANRRISSKEHTTLSSQRRKGRETRLSTRYRSSPRISHANKLRQGDRPNVSKKLAFYWTAVIDKSRNFSLENGSPSTRRRTNVEKSLDENLIPFSDFLLSSSPSRSTTNEFVITNRSNGFCVRNFPLIDSIPSPQRNHRRIHRRSHMFLKKHFHLLLAREKRKMTSPQMIQSVQKKTIVSGRVLSGSPLLPTPHHPDHTTIIRRASLSSRDGAPRIPYLRYRSAPGPSPLPFPLRLSFWLPSRRNPPFSVYLINTRRVARLSLSSRQQTRPKYKRRYPVRGVGCIAKQTLRNYTAYAQDRRFCVWLTSAENSMPHLSLPVFFLCRYV